MDFGGGGSGVGGAGGCFGLFWDFFGCLFQMNWNQSWQGH